jgi:PAS domain S-box-containing protein
VAGEGLRAIGGNVEEALGRVNVPTYVIDTTGIIRWLNPAAERLVGDARGRQFTSVVATEYQRHARELFAKNIAGTAHVVDEEVVLVGRKGDRVGVEVSSVRLHRGERVVGVFGQIKHEPADPPVRAHPALTPRQAEVLRMLEHGRSTAQIAEQLNLSKETVRNHVYRVLRNLGVHSRIEAVALARRHHLLGSE